MTAEEARAMFAPVKCNSQIEFDERMHAINNQQNIENHPYLDQLRELNKRKALLQAQKQAINVQLSAIRVECMEIEQKQKDTNRVFYQLKHELIELNPKGLKNEKA